MSLLCSLGIHKWREERRYFVKADGVRWHCDIFVDCDRCARCGSWDDVPGADQIEKMCADEDKRLRRMYP